MTPRRIVQVSDLHLGTSGGPSRHEQADIAWSQFLEAMTANPPDLIVVTGDIVVDDPDALDDQHYAMDRLAQLDVDVMALPGNHDVGDHDIRDGLPSDWHGALVTAERVERWESLWGPSFQYRDLGDWTLVGLNSQLFGSGLPHEAQQWAWLCDEALPHAQGRSSAVFLHEALHLRPEYQDAGTDHGWMSIPTHESHRLAEVLREAGVDLIGCGHTHKFAQWEIDGLRTVNAPSLVGPIPVRSSMDQPFGAPTPGWLELTLNGAHITIDNIARMGTQSVDPATPAH